jgi:hypothetical protein
MLVLRLIAQMPSGIGRLHQLSADPVSAGAFSNADQIEISVSVWSSVFCVQSKPR